MGLGMVIACAPDKAPEVQAELPDAGVVGEVVRQEGDARVVIE
jgi:phosphoribosylaminoimidazole (AIR) synthetase